MCVCSHNQLGLVKSDRSGHAHKSDWSGHAHKSDWSGHAHKSDWSGHAHKTSSQPQQWRQTNLITTDVMIPTAHRTLPPLNLSTQNRGSSSSLQAPSALVQTTQWVPVCVCVCVCLVETTHWVRVLICVCMCVSGADHPLGTCADLCVYVCVCVCVWCRPSCGYVC